MHRPGHGVTVSTMFRALTTERSLLPELLQVDGLVAEARVKAEKYVAPASGASTPGCSRRTDGGS